MKKADVVIIGTGVIGSSLALSLLEKNKDINVLIIGNKDKAGNATQAAGAMLGCYGEVTETLLKSKYGQDWKSKMTDNEKATLTALVNAAKGM
jgi:glycine/D-amino acid oxidase-like deaminating enzyme